MSDLKVGVIGVGALGRHHARILAGLEGVDLVAVADSREAQGRQVAEQSGCVWVSDFRDLLDDVDAVSVAVPTFAHHSVAVECLSRGIPMMMEKPLAGNLREAREIAELADRRDVILQVGHVERFNPATSAAWAMCGRPGYIRSERVSSFAFRSTDISVIHDLMIHDLDLILDLVGSPVRKVEAFGVALFGEKEDTVQARLHFDSGCIADVTASRVSPQAGRTMQIWSSTGCVSVDFTSREVTRYRPGSELLNGPSPVSRSMQPGADVEQLKQQVFGTFIEVDTPTVSDDDALTAELSHFADCVREQRTPLVDGWSAVRALEVADRIRQAVYAHQWEGHPGGLMGPFLLPGATPVQRRAA